MSMVYSHDFAVGDFGALYPVVSCYREGGASTNGILLLFAQWIICGGLDGMPAFVARLLSCWH